MSTYSSPTSPKHSSPTTVCLPPGVHVSSLSASTSAHYFDQGSVTDQKHPTGIYVMLLVFLPYWLLGSSVFCLSLACLPMDMFNRTALIGFACLPVDIHMSPISNAGNFLLHTSCISCHTYQTFIPVHLPYIPVVQYIHADFAIPVDIIRHTFSCLVAFLCLLTSEHPYR